MIILYKKGERNAAPAGPIGRRFRLSRRLPLSQLVRGTLSRRDKRRSITCRTSVAVKALAASVSANRALARAVCQCNDSYGNSYTVNRMGSMTQMYGNNPYTGSNWWQTSQSLGNMTIPQWDYQRASVEHE
jgi:hypothetical protein